ncbi:MAG: hypothetical protein AAGI30_04505 [Planctomycetota bacterium]
MFGRRKKSPPTPTAPAFPLDEHLFREFIEITHHSLTHARMLCFKGQPKTAAGFLSELEWLVVSVGRTPAHDIVEDATRRLSHYGRRHNDNIGQVHLLKLFGHLTQHEFFPPSPEQGSAS